MRRLSATLGLVVLVAWTAAAHPGSGIVIDEQGRIFFVDGVRNRIMKVDEKGTLSVFAVGKEGGLLSNPHHLARDADGNLYSVGDRDGVVCRIAPDGKVTRLYPPEDWVGITFIGSGGDPFARDGAGNLYCINYRQQKHAQILLIAPDGRVSSLAGGDWGHADGKGNAARFGDLHGASFVLGPDGALYLTDSGTSIRKVAPDGTVTTVAGSDAPGFKDGAAKTARFKHAAGLAFDKDGALLVADSGNGRIRKIARDGAVTSLPGAFENPSGVAVAADGAIYVLEWVRDDPRVKKLSAGTVTLVAEVR